MNRFGSTGNSKNLNSEEAYMSLLIASKIQNNPKYLLLVKQRDTLSWTLSALVCLMYFGFILLIALAPGIITQPISDTSVIPLGMLLGVGVIIASAALTGVYVYKANSTFDPIVLDIVQEASK
jgi:uncharacterized membrane protein (DUF485 family)